ncbi:hypothetical protein SO694_00080119 [Aureococcus anophagefferens]
MEFVVVSRDADLPEGTVVACDDERFDDELRAREFRVAEIVDGAPLDGELWLPLGDLAWLPDGPDLRSFWAIATRRGSSSVNEGRGLPTILFLHAGSLTRHQYRPQLLALSREFHTVALDLAGHGDYAFLEEFELKRSVDRCVGHLRTLGVAECLVVATSLGGNVAGLLAATRPDLVAGLFLHGCTTDFSAPEIHAKFGDLNKIFDRQEAIYGDMKFPQEVMAASMKQEQTASKKDAATAALRNDLWRTCIQETRLNRFSFNHFLVELHGVDGRPGSAATHAGFGDVDDVRIMQPDYDLKPPGQHPLEFWDRQRLNSHRTPGQPPLKFEIVEDAGHYWNLEYPLMYAQRVRDMALDVFADHPRCPPR